MDQFGEMAVALARYLRQRSAGWQDVKISGLTKIGAGWETDVYAVALESATGQESQELILRLYPGSDGISKSGKEFRAIKLLYEMGYAVPEVLLLETSGAALGKPFMLMEKINGPLLGSAFDKASPEKQQELLKLFCRLFVQLHALDYHPFLSDAADADKPQQYAQRRLCWMAEFVRSFCQEEFDPVFEWLLEKTTEVRWGRLSVIHMDYHSGNILLRDGVTPFVIDWGGVDVADYRFDLAWTLLLSSGYGNPQAYGLILGEYERMAGRKVEDIEYFDAWAATRRLFSIVASVRSGAEKLGMRPGAEQMMLRNTKHIRLLYAIIQERTGVSLPRIESWLATCP